MLKFLLIFCIYLTETFATHRLTCVNVGKIKNCTVSTTIQGRSVNLYYGIVEEDINDQYVNIGTRYIVQNLRPDQANGGAVGRGISNDWPYDNTLYVQNPNKIYKKTAQKKSLEEQCPADLWVKDTPGNEYFARGHHAANADYGISEYREATFDMMNSMPQWHKYNNGNWNKIIEAELQKLVKRGTTTYKIITGNYGTLTCRKRDNNGENQLHLKTDDENFTPLRIPIPKIFYKIIYPMNAAGEPSEKSVFIATVNHPSLTIGRIKQDPSFHFCPTNDICDKIFPSTIPSDYEWFKESKVKCDGPDPRNDDNAHIAKGYTYACEFTDQIKRKLQLFDVDYKY